MAEMRAADRSGFLGFLADLLMGAQGGLNSLGTIPQSVPLVGGQGAGDLAFGGGPALMDNMSYGFSPVHGAGMAATLDPAVVDLLALMPGVGRAAGVARDMPGVARQAFFDAYGPATNVARPRYTLGGREVPRETMQAEFGLIPPPAPKPKRERTITPKPKTMAERDALNRDLFTSGGYSIGGDRMSAEDAYRMILEIGKTLPNP